MGTERPTKRPWHPSGPRRSEPREGSRPQPDPEDEKEPPSPWGDPVPYEPEDDLALARMLGCALLIGIAGVIGLALLIF
ncbi:hypothetical protein Rumeso_00070 [Rubellimicrobium mesophilum DSM 19309]|uniref:Uncharacterized protein n=1 Tax=Rubellimicrobium mesophilum DSM 19309 TaxID=442562 RepID=A0A017HV21_9RHOB|nr:hypothetical protein Rumeso_00070 [Rubellimicrobium mesophilum DSM 19309]